MSESEVYSCHLENMKLQYNIKEISMCNNKSCKARKMDLLPSTKSIWVVYPDLRR